MLVILCSCIDEMLPHWVNLYKKKTQRSQSFAPLKGHSVFLCAFSKYKLDKHLQAYNILVILC